MSEASLKKTNGTRINISVWVVLSVLLALVLLPASPAKAADQPRPPHVFYGRLSVDNQSAPVGVTVVAKVDGIECGSIETLSPGLYGSDNQSRWGVGILKLAVKSQPDVITIEDNATIEFYVEGIKANETYKYIAGEVTYLELTVTGPLPPPDDGLDEPKPEGIDWPVVGGILGGAVVIGGAGSFLILRKRRVKT